MLERLHSAHELMGTILKSPCTSASCAARTSHGHVKSKPALKTRHPSSESVEVRAAAVSRPLASERSAHGADQSEDGYREVCRKTVKVIGESLIKQTAQPENVNVVELMQEVGWDLGYRVEYSRGRILVSARAGVAHQLALSSLMRRLHAEESWTFLHGVSVFLPCKTKRQPDISGWTMPISLDPSASQVTQRPDWVCEILSAETKEQDLPGGDRFLEYASSRIPYYWTVDPLLGQIMVYELAGDAFVQIQQASLSDYTKCVVLQPLTVEFDVQELFSYLR